MVEEVEDSLELSQAHQNNDSSLHGLAKVACNFRWPYAHLVKLNVVHQTSTAKADHIEYWHILECPTSSNEQTLEYPLGSPRFTFHHLQY